MTLRFRSRSKISHLTEGYAIIMAESTKDTLRKKNSGMPAARRQGSTNVELSKSKTLAVYDKQEVKVQKQGFFGNLGRKVTLSRGQLEELLLENIEILPEHEARLLRAVFGLKVMTAQEVMVPLSEIVPLTMGSPPSEVLNLCRASNCRYIPVYSERVDWLLGVVDAMEVLTNEEGENDLSSFMKEVCYTPALKSAMDLLGELRQSEIPAAIVVNEHGSCIGVVELIDILEKVIGKITANRKRDTPHIEKLEKNNWCIDARMLIADVNRALDTRIPTDRCDTIGGFVLMLLGRLPQKDEKVEYEDLEFNIDEAFKYGISQIRAVKKAKR